MNTTDTPAPPSAADAGSQALTIYDDRQARRRPVMGPPAVREYRWGTETVIIGGVIQPRHPGVSHTLLMLGDQGGPARMRWHDERRYPNQGWTCVGCPHFGISGREMYCVHPLYIELFEAPQYRGSLRDVGADRECPMLARRTEAAQRRYRWHCKSSDIFWRYYHDSKQNPYKHGFAWIYPMHRLGPVNTDYPDHLSR